MLSLMYLESSSFLIFLTSLKSKIYGVVLSILLFVFSFFGESTIVPEISILSIWTGGHYTNRTVVEFSTITGGLGLGFWIGMGL